MDLEEVKVCLRALLSSTPLSYRVNSLLLDFKNTTGFNLPLFGHSNPVEFLQSMKDTLKLQGDPFNPEVALVKSNKSAHILSLVDRQKVDDKIKTKSSYFMARQRRHIVQVKDPDNFDILPKDCYLRQPGGKEMKFPLLCPVKSQNLPCSKRELPKQAIHNAEVPSPPKTAFPPQPKPIMQPLLINTYTEIQNPQKTFFHREATPVQSIGSQESGIGPPQSTEKTKTDNCYFEDISDNDSYPDTEEPKSDSTPAPIGFINSGIKNKLKKLIKNYPKGLWCCELPELFFEEYNFVLDYREYGYTSLIQMLSELPEVFRCVRPGNEDWILFDASISPSAEEKKILDLQQRGDMMCSIKANIQKLLAKCCENSAFAGVEVDKISDVYQEMFGTSLEFHSLGFKDVKSLLEMWDDNILNIVNIGGKLYCGPASKRTAHSPVRWEEALPPITAENDIFVEIFPKDVVGPEECLSQLDLTRHIAVGHVVEVSVAEVWSPSKFFVQLNKFKNRLNRFMDDLQKFYNVHLNKFKMPDSTLRPNQVCVGLYNADPEFPDEWHRAQIIKVINEKTVLVNFVDYGTVTRVKKTQLRFLHRNFQSFPIQAFQAQLSGVVPPNDEAMWPMTTSKKFLELLRVPYLNAEMVDIDFKKPALSVILFDPLQKSKPNINKKLVQDKLARPGKPLYFREGIPEAKLPETETKGLSENSSGALVRGDFYKNEVEKADEFLDIDDLNHSTLFPFKMKSLTPDQSSSGEVDKACDKTESPEISYEFDFIPELKGGGGEKEPKVDAKKENCEARAPTATEVLAEPTLPEPEKESKPSAELPDPKVPQSDTTPTEQTSKSKRLPPGLEHLNALPDLPQFPLLLPPQDLKKKINILAMELLTKNPSIKQVGVSDPALALRIATEMAEAYFSSEMSMSLPLCYNLYPLFPQPLPGCVPPSAPQPHKDKPPAPSTTRLPSESLPPLEPQPVLTADQSSAAEGKISSKENTPCGSPSKIKLHQRAEHREYIEEAAVGGKILHLVKIDKEIYFCSEELVHQFTSFSNREIADRVLNAKKIKTDYRVVTKKSNEKVLNAVKSCDLPGVVKRKTKKLKVYLLPVAKATPFLQALGCRTKPFESDILDLQKNWEKRIVEDIKPSVRPE